LTVTPQNLTDVTTLSLEYDSTWQNMTDDDVIVTTTPGSNKRKRENEINKLRVY